MKRTICMIALSLILATPIGAKAENRIVELCGSGHVNEVASDSDVRPNPVGFYVTSVREQISDRDPRVFLSTGDEYYLCTRTAATPSMDTSKTLLLIKERVVKYLFVPVTSGVKGSSS